MPIHGGVEAVSVIVADNIPPTLIQKLLDLSNLEVKADVARMKLKETMSNSLGSNVEDDHDPT